MRSTGLKRSKENLNAINMRKSSAHYSRTLFILLLRSFSIDGNMVFIKQIFICPFRNTFKAFSDGKCTAVYKFVMAVWGINFILDLQSVPKLRPFRMPVFPVNPFYYFDLERDKADQILLIGFYGVTAVLLLG